MRPALFPVMPAHVLVVEHDAGVVLVDTGFGTADLAAPGERLGPVRHLLRPDTDPATTVLGQLPALGLAAEDVTDVVLTHLDLDHAGGLVDLPHARVHTTADEHAAAVTAPDWRDRARYRTAQFAHGPRFVLWAGPGDPWTPSAAAVPTTGVPRGHEVLPGIVLVPMPGHSRGHAAVAVQTDDGVVLHAGDAVFDAATLGAVDPAGRPLGVRRRVRAFERVVGRDQAAIRRNHAVLAGLAATPGWTVVPAHDERLLPPVSPGGRSPGGA